MNNENQLIAENKKLQEINYAITCKESSYNSISVQDIQDKCKEFLER